MKRNKIIRFWIVVLLLLVVEALALSTGWWGPRLFPGCYVSDLYRRYEHADGIRASFLKDYRVNDTLCLDVTLLEATTDAGWDTLKVRFGIKELPPEYQARIDAGEDAISVRQFPKNAPALMKETSSNSDIEVMGISRLYHTVSVFHTTTEQEIHAVLIYNFSLNK